MGRSDNGFLFLTVTGQKIYTENLSRHVTSYMPPQAAASAWSLISTR